MGRNKFNYEARNKTFTWAAMYELARSANFIFEALT